MRHSFHLRFLLLLSLCFVESAGFLRVKRQTGINSNAETSGNGDQVKTDGSTLHFKDDSGIVGFNVTANGNSSGIGLATIGNSAGGSIGNSSVDNVANVVTVGDKSNSYSDIFAAVKGENLSMNVGKAAGQGATLSNVNGGGTLQNSTGAKKSGFSFGNAGGTGSNKSEANILTNQNMTWNHLMGKMLGSASGVGDGSAQSNVDMGSGANNNNMTISALVSGLNSNKGQVNVLVTGNGTAIGDQHYVQGIMVGSAKGNGNSTILEASSVVSNQSLSTETKAFGNSNAYSSGNSSVSVLSNNNIENKNGLGVVTSMGSGQGSKNDIVASNGLKLTDSQQEAAIIGSGVVKGFGSDPHSNASQHIDSALDSNGTIRINSRGDGQSLSDNGTNSSLSINTNGLAGGWKNTSFGVFSNGYGTATGLKNNVSGLAFANVDGFEMNGNSSMSAFGGGNGPSSADTKAILELSGSGGIQNETASGRVFTNGNNTNVKSVSMISRKNGVQTVMNVQKVSNQGGSSSVSSNFVVSKRRKRFAVLAQSLRK